MRSIRSLSLARGFSLIELMIAVAKANLAEKEAEARAARAVARDGAPEEPETVAASVEVETTEVVG